MSLANRFGSRRVRAGLAFDPGQRLAMQISGLVVFLNGVRGEAVLDALLAAGCGVSAVIGPAKPSDRCVETIKRHDLHYESFEDVNAAGSIDQLRALRPRLFVIAGYSKIFKEPLIHLPEFGTINLHAGKVPEYRGGSPLNWQIINGEPRAGISVLRVDAGIDSGDVLAEAEFPIGARDTIADLHERANRLFPQLVLGCLKDLFAGTLRPRHQDEVLAQYWHQRRDQDGHLDFRFATASDADRMIRALTRPYPGAWAWAGERRVRLFAAELPENVIRGAQGRLCYVQGVGPFVICRDRAILLTDFEIENTAEARLAQGTFLR